MVLSPDAFRALKRNKRIRDFMARGVLVNERSLAELFGLSEIRVARRLTMDETTGKLSDIWKNNALLFYSEASASDGFSPALDANYGTPAFAYTYQLRGTPISTPNH